MLVRLLTETWYRGYWTIIRLWGRLHDHDFEGQTGLLRAAEALKKAGNSALEVKAADMVAGLDSYSQLPLH
ncbi:hypothetical protein N7540_001633 [Penicillium herquei]|nr:hypothetical protein N7540_001633 [Penicillium herquei]